jgi:hypothetical protein
MKIPIYIPGHKKCIVIEKQYYCDDLIIPIGCDCHPTWMLNKLHIRNQSLPFDWLLTDSLQGLHYVADNLLNDFKFYQANTYKNIRNNVAAEKYPFSEFVHEGDLIENQRTQKKMQRRVERFKSLFKENKTIFIHNVISLGIKSDDDVSYFLNSVNEFLAQIKPADTLHLYIRYDESFDENKAYCDALFDKLKRIKRVHAAKYIRYLEKDGIWGSEMEYPQLMSDLKIPIKSKFLPIISIQ